MPNKTIPTLAALALAAVLGNAQAANSPKYEAALERYYDLTYGHQIEQLGIDELSEKFREGAMSKPEAKACPALGKAIDDFSKNEFRKAITDYFHSPELKAQIVAAMRKQLTEADLNAYLAFVDTPAGKSYLAHSQASHVEVEKAIAEMTEKMDQSPAFKTMMTDMVAKLVPVMMTCNSKK
ncbi:MAG: DUF2059 domain-containing protein [Lysobacter sp.]|nr:DUF2059 domain-containing protein [Lysobacter sp.]